MASDLETGLRTGARWEETRYLDTIYATNGYDRPLEILGDGSDVRPIGSDTPAVGSWAHGRTGCSYKVAYGYRNGNGRWVWSNWSDSQDGDGTTAITAIPTSSEGHVTHKKLVRTTASSGSVFYDLVILANATTTYTDGTNDTTLQGRDEVDVTQAHDRPLAKRYITSHKGKLIVGGEVTETLGSVAVTNGNATVTGTGTHFTAAQVGKRITIGSDAISYIVNAVATTTSLTLGDGSGSMNYLGSTASAQAYTIEGDEEAFYWSLVGYPEYFKNSGTAPQRADLPGSDLHLVGFGRAGSQLLLFTQKATFEVDIYSETAARIDQAGPAVGAVGQRSIVETGDRVIWLGRENIYEYNGRDVRPIGINISPFTRSLNETIVQEACGAYWRKYGYIVFAVPGSAETDNRTLIVGLDWVRLRGQPVWYIGECAPIGDLYSYIVEGEAEEVAGVLTNGRVIALSQDESDDLGGVSGSQSGTLTTATSTTITDSAATFATTGSGLAGLLVYVRAAADGTVQSRVISSNAGTTITPESPWTTTPTIGDAYAVAPIAITLRLGRRDMQTPGERKKFQRLGFEMDNGYDGSETADLDLYLGGSTTKEVSGTIDPSQNWDYVHAGVRARDIDAELRCIHPDVRWNIEAIPITYVRGKEAKR